MRASRIVGALLMLLHEIEVVEISLVLKDGLLCSGSLPGTHFVYTWKEFSARNSL